MPEQEKPKPTITGIIENQLMINNHQVNINDIISNILALLTKEITLLERRVTNLEQSKCTCSNKFENGLHIVPK